eukprot:scaffold6537_cov175-Prasinococcus_capsulatus_cf.AAC.1
MKAPRALHTAEAEWARREYADASSGMTVASPSASTAKAFDGRPARVRRPGAGAPGLVLEGRVPGEAAAPPGGAPQASPPSARFEWFERWRRHVRCTGAAPGRWRAS